MLVLSRKAKQGIVFPSLGIKVDVIKVFGNSVRLGISAPPDVRVVRDELELEGQGEKFSVELSLPVNATNPLPGTGARHALLVEDNPVEARLLTGFLRLHNIQVTLAEHGAEALELLSQPQAQMPDCVLLDMHMPRYDGRWTIQQIRQSDSLSRLRVIAVSGMAPNQFGVEVGPRGVNGWLQKPFDPNILVQQMDLLSYQASCN